MLKSIKELPLIDRPRERLLTHGAQVLSDEELLCVLISRGVRGKNVQILANEVLKVFDLFFEDDFEERLGVIGGLGSTQRCQILAALEFARRRIRPEGIQIKKPEDMIPHVAQYADKKQEHFLVATLNGAKEIIALRCISIGLVNSAQVHPREVFSDAIEDRASSIIVLHNHPSGQLIASEADKLVTKNLIEAGRILGIPLLDHIIFASRGRFLSLREDGEVLF